MSRKILRPRHMEFDFLQPGTKREQDKLQRAKAGRRVRKIVGLLERILGKNF